MYFTDQEFQKFTLKLNEHITKVSNKRALQGLFHDVNDILLIVFLLLLIICSYALVHFSPQLHEQKATLYNDKIQFIQMVLLFFILIYVMLLFGIQKLLKKKKHELEKNTKQIKKKMPSYYKIKHAQQRLGFYQISNELITLTIEYKSMKKKYTQQHINSIITLSIITFIFLS